MIDRDDWSERELLEGEAYAVTCGNILQQWLKDLQTLEVLLPKDKRAVVEITALLDLAAMLAQEHLQLDSEDFATSACHVYMQRTG